ncbi:ABC transporter substrate-binding protein [Robbsia andropogonis]|uniref:ABC transporter substrate-binding protein n=1 Tax=Robbsia andropogonis TaxID=28092 RepID=UPI000A7C98C9|nr:ABC transporter substrate-binding protein [Robbsia andropogonis]
MTASISEIIREQPDASALDDRSAARSGNVFVSPASPTAPVDRLWYTRCPAPTPFGVAIQQGGLAQAFAADGIHWEALQDASDPVVRRSHYTHSQPHSFRQGGNIPALWARANGALTRVIGLSWVDEFQGIIALPSSMIRHVSDLRGRRLGLPHNPRTDIVDFHRATALRGYDSLLDVAGLTLRDVALVPLAHTPTSLAEARATADNGLAMRMATERPHEFAREVAALLSGEVEAVFVKGAPGLEAVNIAGARIIVEIEQHSDRLRHANNGTPRPLTVDTALLTRRPDLVAKALGAAVSAGEWALAHPDQARAYIAREVRAAEHWVAPAYPRGSHTQLTIGLDPQHIAALDNFKAFLVKHGFLSQDFDLSAWIDASVFDRLTHERVVPGVDQPIGKSSPTPA